MVKKKAKMREWSTETQNIESHVPAIPYGNRDCGSRILKDMLHPTVEQPLPALDLPESDF